jgi:predicted enzyme related to lactoylglutathione lyase
MSDINTKHNRFVWCDIHVDDLDRACAIYEGVIGNQVPGGHSIVLHSTTDA